jgi:hypothetical protein
VFTELAFESDPWGLYRFRYISGRMPYRSAAEHLLKTPGTVFLLTGFYILRARTLETDGITGTWVLYQSLKSLGYVPLIPADSNVFDLFKTVFSSDCLIEYPVKNDALDHQTARDLLARHKPETIISIERPGPLSDGSFRNFNNDSISGFCARLDHLWTGKRLKIAIGDSGNELGMGVLTDWIPDNRLLCPLRANFTLLGSTSDYAAWCLAASLETMTGTSLMPPADDVIHFLQHLPEKGFVDGITAAKTPTVDGFSQHEVAKKYRQIQNASRLIGSASAAVQKFVSDDSKSHAVPIISIHPHLSRSGRSVELDGFVLLGRQLKQLKTLLRDAGIEADSFPAVLSDSDAFCGDWLNISELTMDLFDRPDGHRTTQIADYDKWVRRLYVWNRWGLYQTPDCAMGWSDNQVLLRCCAQKPETHPWKTIVRPLKNACLSSPNMFSALVNTAEQLRSTPYLWGGRNPNGLDCSGMTQRIFYQTGVLLPRNSRDQRRCGKRVSFNNMASGDLLFATRKTNGFHHVALVLPDGIQHACLDEKHVIVEPIHQFRDCYTLIGVRRISSFA